MTADFTPKRFKITAFSNELEPTITTDLDHGYAVGWYVALWVPKEYGMSIPFLQQSKIISIPATNQMTIDFDTRNLEPFVVPVITPNRVAQVMPISGQFTNSAVR